MQRIVLIKRRTALILLIFAALCLIQAGYLTINRVVPSLYRTPGTFYMLKTEEKVVALTFDDGPDPSFTPQVLDILKKNNIRATFFVLGKSADANPQLLTRMKIEGHEIASHGFTHDYQQLNLTDDLVKTDKAVFAATGLHTQFYRPPGGRVNKQQLAVVNQNGHTLTLWSVDSGDWINPGSKKIVSNVLKKVFPGAMILLHDGGDNLRGQTINALPTIIEQLKEMGYRFVTVGEMKVLEATANHK